MKKLAAIIAALFIPVATAQTSTTPNLVGSYTNTYNTTNLNCWSSGDIPSGYCSPNGQPYYRPDNAQINFSYGMWDIYQNRNVSTVLPSGGTGLVITGWHFRYDAKVGNGWDDGSYDYLKSYVRIYGQGGQLIEQANFVHGGTHNWSTFNLANSYNPLTSRYTTDNFTQIRYGFVGQDYNGWVGPYGPEVYQVSFTLNYQPDPCLRSQLVSPQCPGFLDAIQKASALPKQENTVVQEAAVAAITPTTLANAQETKKVDAPVAVARKAREEVKFASVQQEVSMPVQETATTQTQQTATTAAEQTRTTQQSKSQTARTNNSQATETQTASMSIDVGAMEQAGSAQTKTTDSVNTAQTTTTTLPSPTPVVAINTEPVMPDLPVVTQQQVEPEQQQATQTALKMPEPVQQPVAQVELPQPTFTEPSLVQTEQTIVQSVMAYTPPPQLQAAQAQTQVEQATVVEQPVLAKQEQPAQEVAAALPSNMLTDKTNPINDVVTAQPQMPTMAAFSGPVVNQKSQDNDAAGGVSIAQIARVPVGFEAYNVALRDVAFYAPREIYRNQRNVDNTRALRQMSSDKLHQEMVDQQYRR